MLFMRELSSRYCELFSSSLETQEKRKAIQG